MLKPFHSEKILGHQKWSLSTHRNGHLTIHGSDTTLIDPIEPELPILKKDYLYKGYPICASPSR